MTERMETVREAISRRAIDALVAVHERFELHPSKVEDCHFAARTIYEMVLPFVTPDIKDTLTDIMRAWDSKLVAVQEAQAERRAVMPESAPRLTDAESW